MDSPERPRDLRALLTLSPFAVAIALGTPGTASAQIARVEEVVTLPPGMVTVVAFPPGDSRRMFVGTQAGLLRVVVDGVLLTEPVLDLQPTTVAGSESGLLGLAFHPEFGSNGKFYVLHSERLAPGTFPLQRDAVAEYTMEGDPAASVRASPGSRRRLLQLNSLTLHHGGWMGFGPDRMLHVAVGDGGPAAGVRDLTTLAGKMLRIDVDGRGPGLEYAIPPDNPFVLNPPVPGARGEIWALGLRNPWRCSFDRAIGDLWIGDVGSNIVEEINLEPGGSAGGRDYGWPCFEGLQATGLPVRGCDPLPVGTTPPAAMFPRSDMVSIIGGHVYRGSLVPLLSGRYVFADHAGEVYSFEAAVPPTAATPLGDLWLFDTATPIATVGEDGEGELFLGCWGRVLRIVAEPCGPADLSAGSSPGVRGYGQPNGVLDADDFWYFMAEFAAGNIAVADLTAGAIPGDPGYGSPDGVLNNDDFFYYLAIFTAGC